MKNRSLGIVLIILGVLVNNYAYLTDIVGDTHDGLIFLGWKGIMAAVLGLMSVLLGVVALLQAAKTS